jgi:hypothetical protein
MCLRDDAGGQLFGQALDPLDQIWNDFAPVGERFGARSVAS